ncbi:MAG: hypothetical protein ACTSYI_00460 [Promethearchaeota archaeon]
MSCIVIVVLGSSGIYLFYNSLSHDDEEFYYGVRSWAVEIDPQNAQGRVSINVIEQVCEGLFGYNLTDDEMGIIPVLAASMGT